MKKKFTELLDDANKGEKVFNMLFFPCFLVFVFIPQSYSVLNNADKHSKYENLIRDAAADILPEFKEAKIVDLPFEDYGFFDSSKDCCYFDTGKNQGILCVSGRKESIKLESQIKDGLHIKSVPLKELSKNPDIASLNFGNRIFAILVWSFFGWLFLYRPFKPIQKIQQFLMTIRKGYVPKKFSLFPGITLLSVCVWIGISVLGRITAILLLILLSM
ncbi:hypothetical protein [Sedimentisphaera salicampi]|uniref:Uncharacterized protein n=1 Tax=Sedimentisphaera salicampi TaxID=1941349 RepID=A0A1W6LLC9_9BACT|nr:hypothetical protein [Sedimentisphaera salicampi]ARN56567.1 hypothetical protein STSP1_00950 [Sedimentisphaera salicampi]